MIKKWTLKISHRPKLDDDIKSRHKRFMSQQSGVGKPWEIPDNKAAVVELRPGDLVAIIQLGSVLPKKMKGNIQYSLRHQDYLADTASTDDRIVINFHLNDVDFEDLVVKIFPKLVSAFEAYRATVYAPDLGAKEFPEIQRLTRETGKEVDGRDGVYRILPIVFYDRELCKRGFNLSPEEMVKRLDGHVEKVYLHEDGVVIVYSSKPVDEETYMSIDGELRKFLKQKQKAKLFGLLK